MIAIIVMTPKIHLFIRNLLLLLIGSIAFSSIAAISEESSYKELIEKARFYKYKNTDSTLYFANKAYNIADKNNDAKLDALFLMIKANIKSGMVTYALSLCDTAQLIIDKNKLFKREYEVLLYRGNLYQSMGFAAKALEIFLDVQTNLDSHSSAQYRADLYYYMAVVYYELGEINKANNYLLLSLDVANNENLYQHSFSNYLLLSLSTQKIDSIQKYITLADNIIEKHPNLSYEKVSLRNNQARFNKAFGRYDESKKQYNEAIGISLENGFQKHLLNLYNNYAYLLMAVSNYDSAYYYLSEALVISKKIKSLDMESEIYDSFSDYFERTGDFKNALKYTDMFVKKRNAFREQQSRQRSIFLSAVFESEQKEKEILQQENEIATLWLYMLGAFTFLAVAIGFGGYFRQKLSLSRARLETFKKGKELEIADAMINGQDAERKRLAMDLHDGLGARLGSLRFLVDGFFKANNKYNDVVNSINNITHNVRELSHRMLPSQLESLGLPSTINNLASSINKSDKFHVDFETNLEIRLSSKLEINIYYLIYELINNATKHSKGNSIFVQLLEHDDGLSLSVEDNGGGFKLNDNNTGHGLKNIKTRIEYLGGEFFIDSNDEETNFLIEIPNEKT
jgi:two-component system, NarL family, sensor kinase